MQAGAKGPKSQENEQGRLTVPDRQQRDRRRREGFHLERQVLGDRSALDATGNRTPTHRLTSTPVPPTHSVLALTLTHPPAASASSPFLSNPKSTSTPLSASVWHSGIRSAVRLAPMIPAS